MTKPEQRQEAQHDSDKKQHHALCTQLDTSRAVANGRLYLWDLLITAAYFAPPALTDTMCLDSAAIRSYSQDTEARETFCHLISSGQLTCLRRKAPDFRTVLMKMLRAEDEPMWFSSLKQDENKRVRAELADRKNMTDEDLLWRFSEALGIGNKTFESAAISLEEWFKPGKDSLTSWPTPSKPFARSVLDQIGHLEAKDPESLKETSGGAKRLRDHLDAVLNMDNHDGDTQKDVDRTTMWKKLGYTQGKPLPFAEARCKEIVDREYLFRFPDALGWSTVHHNTVTDRILPSHPPDFLDDLCCSAIYHQHRASHLAPIQTNPGVLRALAEHVAARDFVPLFTKLATSRDPENTTNDFHEELSQAIGDSVSMAVSEKRPHDPGDPARRITVYGGMGALLGGLVAVVNQIADGLPLGRWGTVRCFIDGASKGGSVGLAVGAAAIVLAPLLAGGTGRLTARAKGRSRLRELFPRYSRLLRESV